MIHVSTIDAVHQIMKSPYNVLHNKPRKSVQYNLSQEDNDIIFPSEVYKDNQKLAAQNDDVSFADVKNFDFLTEF
jgi:hypothetical protein